MPSPPYTLTLKISIGSNIYVLGTVSVNATKEEFSYHLAHSESSPDKHLNLTNNTRTMPPDHITWHKKSAHIRRLNKILQTHPYAEGCLFPTEPKIKPIFVEGIYLNDPSNLFRKDSNFDKFKSGEEYLLLSMPKALNFSLVFLLVPGIWKTPDIVTRAENLIDKKERIPFWYLRAENHEIGRIKGFQDWDLMILTTPYTRILPPIDSRLGKDYRTCDFISPISSLSSLIRSAKEKPSLTQEIIEYLTGIVTK